MKIVTIKPSPLSKKFRSTDSMQSIYSKVDAQTGKTTDQTVGEFKTERLPNSSQIERTILFSTGKRRWVLKDYDTNSEELNDLVKKCNFINDLRNHPDFGRNITTCDVYNAGDPFFSNSALKLVLFEGAGMLKVDKSGNPKDYLLYKGALSNSRFQISGDKVNPALSNRAKYILVDKDIDSAAKEKSIDNELEAIDLWRNMSASKKVAVAMSIGLPVNDDSPEQIVKEILYDFLKDSTTIYLGDLTKQEYFIKVAKADTEELNISKTIQKAITGGIIRKDKDLGFTAFGGSIGKDKVKMTSFLMNPENSDILHRIQTALENQ